MKQAGARATRQWFGPRCSRRYQGAEGLRRIGLRLAGCSGGTPSKAAANRLEAIALYWGRPALLSPANKDPDENEMLNPDEASTGRALTGRVAITARMLGSGLLLPGLAQHHATNNTYTEHVQPTMRKIEQMRVH